METHEEIKKGLECCVPAKDVDYCDECPYRGVSYCYEARIEDALTYIQQLEAAQPKWISVRVRLPEPKMAVLVCGEVIQIAYTRGRGEGWFTFNGHLVSGVTHWMPLPQPPKEEA